MPSPPAAAPRLCGSTRVDKDEYRSRWEQTIREAETSDPILAKIKADEEQDALSRRLNENENHFNEENLRHAYRAPSGSIIDFIRAALGLTRMKSREGQAREVLQEMEALGRA